MYKKITHNIVEEHFDHPAALPREIAVGLGAPLPPNVMTESTMLFRMDARTLWSKYVWGLLNYGISLNNKLPGTDIVEARVLKNADAIGDFIVPYYGLAAGNQLSEILEKIARIGVDVVNLLKDKGTLNGSEKLWTDAAEELATFLNKLNPGNWPKDAVAEYIDTLLKFWVSEMQSRAKQDWKTSEMAIDNINQLVVTGISNNGKSFQGLADVFSRGIIAQFPDRFAL